MQTVRDIIYRGEGMNGVTVYGDVLFLINFSMDFLLLFSTSKNMHLRASAKRLLISAALGGAYGVAALFIGNTVLTLVCNAAAAYLLCFLAFPRAGRLILLKCTALFYGLSVLLGGGIVASYLLLSKLGHGIASDSYAYPLMSDIPLGTFLILGAVSMALAYVTGRIFGRQSGKHEVKVKITGVGLEDLISIGTIGLIKGVNTYDGEKNIKLATYCSRCIENEILMYIRKNTYLKAEVSLDEPINVDWDGNELLVGDVLGSDPDSVSKDIEENEERTMVKRLVGELPERERQIIELRFGLRGGQELTQKEVADMLGISQSYISRLEKKIIERLKERIENSL